METPTQHRRGFDKKLTYSDGGGHAPMSPLSAQALVSTLLLISRRSDLCRVLVGTVRYNKSDHVTNEDVYINSSKITVTTCDERC